MLWGIFSIRKTFKLDKLFGFSSKSKSTKLFKSIGCSIVALYLALAAMTAIALIVRIVSSSDKIPLPGIIK